MPTQPRRPHLLMWMATLWARFSLLMQRVGGHVDDGRTWLGARVATWRTWGPHLLRWGQSRWQSTLASYRRQTPLKRALIAFLLFLTVLSGPTGLVLTQTDFGRRLLGNVGPQGITRDTTHSVTHLPPTPPVTAKPGTARPPMPHGFAGKPQEIIADPAGATFLSDDGRFEADVPAGAVTAQDLAGIAGHQEKLRITQLAPASGATAGGSGQVSFGSYLVELVDGAGNRVNHGFHQPVKILLHYAAQERAFNLEGAFVVFNGAHLKSITGLGPTSSQPLALDRAKQTLGTQLPADPALGKVSGATLKTFGSAASAASATNPSSANAWGLSFNSTSPVAKFANPDPLNVNLPSGSLVDALKIDVPAGPAGIAPPISLTYNSGGVSEQHNPQGAAGWVGEGWNMSLGAITWSERDYNSRCGTCSQIWQNQWFLSDPFGTSTELLPPATNTSTYYDDSPNAYCASGNASSVPCPIQFHTAAETYAKVYAYVGGNNYGNPNGSHTLCFRVYLTNGIMEEFGCSLDSVHYDSLQYYVTQSTSCPKGCLNGYFFPTAYFPDLITYPQGDQIHLTYQTDWEQTTGGSYPRDTVLNTIEWDAPDCTSTSQACTSTWHPHYRVQFNASHSPARLTNSPSNCNTGTNLRCDDPLDLSGSGGISAPQVNSTLVLNDLAVQTNMSGNGGAYNAATWNTVRDYRLSYEQSGPTTITDPMTGKQQSVAGYLDLTQIQQVGTDGNPANGSPVTTFGYSSQTQYYEDGTFTPYSTSACGPSWNTGGNGNPCDLWSQSYDSNSRYLTSVGNGIGQTQAVTWANARSNTHGVNSGGSAFDPLYCNTHQSGYPCNEADDQQWSRIVATTRNSSVLRITQNGQGGTQTSTPITGTYTYTYQVPAYTSHECTDCNQGFYWGDENNADYLDYYNPHFAGFAQTSVSNPDGSLEIHKFYASEGWGVWNTSVVTCTINVPPWNGVCSNSPWWDLGNAGHGREYEADAYDTNGTTLLRKVTSQYQAVCPPPGGATSWNGKQASELDNQSNPMVGCDVQLQQTTTVDRNGATSDSVAPSSTNSYTYDAYGRVTQTVATNVNGGTTSGSPQTITQNTTYIQNDGLVLPAAQQNNTIQEGAWGGLYLIDTTAASETLDPSGNKVGCAYFSYDGAAYATGQQSSLIHGNATQQDGYTTTCSANKLSVKASYDSLGNPVTSTDANGTTGCTANGISATSCITFGDVTQAKPTSTANALNQISSLGYDTSAAGGFGLWPVSSTDPNTSTTTSTYDVLGRVATIRLPTQTTGLPSTQMTYTYFASCSGAQTVCYEVDAATRTASGTAVTQRTFYDGAYRLVETRTPAPGGMDSITYTLYDVSGRASTTSDAYLVTAYAGAPGPSAYSIPDSSVPTSQILYDGLGRTIQVTDPLGHVSTAAYHAVCNAAGTSDTACYAQTLAIDANGHQQGSLTDGLGRSIYAQAYTGNSGGTYAVYRTTKTTYDTTGRAVSILHPDGSHTTSLTYDTAGRLTAMSDPDRGSESYSYDANGNVTQTTDARGAGTSGTPDTVLGGDTAIEATASTKAAGTAVAFSFVASASGTANKATFYLDSTNQANKVNVGIYSDASGHPGTQLSQATLGALTSGTWNSITLPSTTLTSGTTYWLAILSPTTYGTLAYRQTSATGTALDVSASTTLTALPGTWSSGGTTAGTVGSGYVSTSGTPGTSGGIIYAGYDSLNRQLWRNTTNSSNGAYATYSYDSTANGNVGIGRLTGETFNTGASLGAGSYAYTYDALGRMTARTIVLDGTSYPFTMGYNDAGQATSLTYPDGETLSSGYDTPSGWLTSLVTTPSGGTAQNLVSSIAYTGTGGAAGLPSGATLNGGTYTTSAAYDAALRLTSRSILAGSTTDFASTRTYDAVGNVASVATTLSAGTDNQAFCYDEQNRLTWAGATGTPPCTGTAITAGSLTAANYSQSYAYDVMDRLTTGPAGTYTYGNSAHLHAATSTTGGYTASYDASGNLTCRAPTNSTTCTGTVTGAPLTFDTEGRLTHWQEKPSNPGKVDTFAYDGEGNRVAQKSIDGSTTTTWDYLGEGEELKIVNGVTTTIKYYSAPGLPTLIKKNTTFYVMASDGLGSVSAALNFNGTVTSQQLFAPYGVARYTNGTSPIAEGFTGQTGDSITGLDYFNARYYDPAIGQFASADTVLDGLNRYGYVHGNPETATDPSGYFVDPVTETPAMDSYNFSAGSGGGGGAGPAIVQGLINLGTAIWGFTQLGNLVRGGPRGYSYAPPRADLLGDVLPHSFYHATSGSIPIPSGGSGSGGGGNPPLHHTPVKIGHPRQWPPTATGSGSGSGGGGRPPVTAASPQNNDDFIDAHYGAGTANSGGKVRIWRAIDANEYNIMKSGGPLRYMYSQTAAKFFTFSEAEAINFGKGLASQGIGPSPYYITSGTVDVQVLRGPEVSMGEIRAYVGTIDEIGFFGDTTPSLDIITDVSIDFPLVYP